MIADDDTYEGIYTMVLVEPPKKKENRKGKARGYISDEPIAQVQVEHLNGGLRDRK